MRKIWVLIVCLALFAGCNKEEKDQLDRLQAELGSLQARSESELPAPGQVAEPGVFGISFDQDSYWADAAGSVTAHYTLLHPATLEAVPQGGWSAVVKPAGDKEGDIVITAPDPASPGIIVLKATDSNGNTAETLMQVMVRMPCTDATCPTIEAMAYFCFVNDAMATPENFQKLVEAGITMITVEGDWGIDWRLQARLAEQYGIKVVLFVNGSAGYYSADPEHYKGLDEKILEAETYPAIVAYQIADEPSTEKAYDLKVAKERINQLAPGHPVYINLHPSSVSQAGMGAVTYEEYVEYYANLCNLEFITFDQYPIWIWGVEDGWYRSLDVISSTAKRHGVPFWSFIQSCREFTRVDPTVPTMRLQGNINLAYGSQCNQYFVWKNTSGTDYAPIVGNGTYTQAYDDVKDYNREMHNREFVFAGGDVHYIRHTGNNYYIHGTCLTAADYPDAISDISVDGSSLVSFIGNNGNEYVVICNKSYEDKLPLSVTFTREVYTIDRDKVFTEQKPGKTDFTIDEGDMLVIKWR